MSEQDITGAGIPGASAPTPDLAAGPAAKFWAAKYETELTKLEAQEIKTNVMALAGFLLDHENS